MKKIQPVTVWFNGAEQQATVLGATANSDNLFNSASFSYQLFKEVEQSPMNGGLLALVSGGLTMTGEVYQNWETNDYAYDWVAAQLNLTIVGPYVPTTTTTTTKAPITTTSTTTAVPSTTTTSTTKA